MNKPQLKIGPIAQIIAKIIVASLFLGCIALAIWKWPEIMAVFGPKDSIEDSRLAVKAWLDGLGAWAPFAFILVQFLQVVIFVIPGEVPQIAGGYFFGIGLGLVYSIVGIGLGSAFAFLTARLLGIAFVTKLFGQQQLAKFESFISSPRAKVAFFLLFLIPGIPKDILCYVAGISFLSLGSFMAISMVARLPALFGSVVFGHAAAGQNWWLLITVGVFATILFGLGVIYRARIHDWVEKLLHHEDKTPK